MVKALERESSLSDYTRQELNRFQEVLGLEDKDLESIKSRLLLSTEEVQSQPLSSPQLSNTASPPVQPQYREERVGGWDLRQGAAPTPTDPTPSLSRTSSPQTENIAQPLQASSEAKSKPPGRLSSKAARRSVLLGSMALGLVLTIAGIGSNSIGLMYLGLLSFFVDSMSVWIWGRAQEMAPWRNHGILKIFFGGSLLLSGLLLMSWASDRSSDSLGMFFFFCILLHLTTTFVGRW